jgi:hypothetical protein
VANNKINGDKKYTSNTGDLDGHVDTVVQCGPHCQMEGIVLSLGKCSRRITLAAVMVNNLE